MVAPSLRLHPSHPLPVVLLTDKEVGLASKAERKKKTSLVGNPAVLACAVRVHSLAPRSPGPISQGCVGQCARMLSIDTSCSGDPHPHPCDESELSPLPTFLPGLAVDMLPSQGIGEHPGRHLDALIQAFRQQGASRCVAPAL